MTRVWICGLVFTLVGVTATLGGYLLWRGHRRFLAGLTRTTGTIVETLASDVDGQQMYRPVVAFTPPGSTDTYRATESTYHGAVRWQIGDPHEVLYDATAPERSQLTRSTGHLFGAQLCAIFGITFLAIGLAASIGYVAGPDTAYGRFVQTALSS